MFRTGSWIPVFYVMIACDITAAFMALLWLKPVATRAVAKAEGLALTAALAQAETAAQKKDEKHLVGAASTWLLPRAVTASLSVFDSGFTRDREAHMIGNGRIRIQD
jgi:hypothetical protein